MSDLSATDVMAMQDGGFGGSAFMWIFALLILAGGGFGGFGNSNGNAARQEDIQRAVDLNSIQTGQADITATVQRTAYETMGSVKDASYNNLSEIRDVQNQVNLGFSNLANGFSDLKLENANNKYDIVNAIHSEGEATRNMIQTNKIEELQQQVNNLQMQNAINAATFGTVKYPTTSTWSMNGNPFCPATVNSF